MLPDEDEASTQVTDLESSQTSSATKVVRYARFVSRPGENAAI